MLATGPLASRRSCESVRTTREAELLADGAVRQLTQDVGVSRMASGLLDHMDHDPAQAALPLLVRREVIERCRSDDLLRSRDFLFVERRHRLDRIFWLDPKIDVRVGFVFRPG